ncbi:MAG: hypothetical protein KDI74_00685 [Gammaproteobacteria bacterium]|nr:hypothetical protein [Gammaproteobacteria bacterium]
MEISADSVINGNCAEFLPAPSPAFFSDSLPKTRTAGLTVFSVQVMNSIFQAVSATGTATTASGMNQIFRQHDLAARLPRQRFRKIKIRED